MGEQIVGLELLLWRSHLPGALQWATEGSLYKMNAYRTYANGEAVEHHVFDDPRWDVSVIRVDPAVEIWESDV